MSEFHSYAFGIGTKNNNNEWLEVYYPAPCFKPEESQINIFREVLGYQGGNVVIDIDDSIIEKLIPVMRSEDSALLAKLKGSDRPRPLTLIETDTALTTTPEVYLKLHLLSLRYCKPHEQNLEGIYPLLPNVAWTEEGAVDIEELPARQLQARLEGRILEVSSIDKFPKMTNYVVPSGVRVAHSARVRLGAYLGEGTTVMHEGFVNFNAGSLGHGMIEGRISQGVTLGDGSDLGGSASTMGTLSGGNDIVISIGKNCLIGANAGTGIPLGDRCTIEAGLFVTAGANVQVIDENRQPVNVVKARVLAGQSDMLFIRNSQTGQIECRTNQKAIQLNKALHAHN